MHILSMAELCPMVWICYLLFLPVRQMLVDIWDVSRFVCLKHIIMNIHAHFCVDICLHFLCAYPKVNG